jgi:hypothetical protein
MGVVKQGQGSIAMIGVSPQAMLYRHSTCSHIIQTCIEGITGVDPHIGGDALHRMCYDALQPSWNEWSKGYHVPLERTTLRGVSVYAPIAGKARQEPANERDAIFDQFMTTRKNGQVFKPRQIDLAVIIDDNDFQCAEDRREEILNLDENYRATKSQVRGWLYSYRVYTYNSLLNYRLPALDVSQRC